MRVSPKPKQQAAFTLTELVVVALMLGLLFGLLVPTLYHVKQKSKRIGCVSNLKNLGLAFRVSATDRGDRPPSSLSTNQIGSEEFATPRELFRYFQAMSNEVATPKILACPADDRKPAPSFAGLGNNNISYFLGLPASETSPHTLLAGDRNLSVNGAAQRPGVFELTTNVIVGWTKDLHRFRGNVTLGDGSVQQLSQPQLNAWIGASGGATNRLVIP